MSFKFSRYKGEVLNLHWKNYNWRLYNILYFAQNARRRLSGRSEAGSRPVKKAPETNEEYTERFERGEVNPLEDDGAI